MKAARVQLHSFLNLALERGARSTSHLIALCRGKEPWCPLDRRPGGPQSQSACFGKNKNLSPLLGITPRWSSLYPSCYTKIPGPQYNFNLNFNLFTLNPEQVNTSDVEQVKKIYIQQLLVKYN